MGPIEQFLEIRLKLRNIHAVAQYNNSLSLHNNSLSTVAFFHKKPWEHPQEIFRQWAGTDANFTHLNKYLENTHHIIINCGEHFISHYNLVKFICADSNKEAMQYVSPTKATHWNTQRYEKLDPYNLPP